MSGSDPAFDSCACLKLLCKMSHILAFQSERIFGRTTSAE